LVYLYSTNLSLFEPGDKKTTTLRNVGNYLAVDSRNIAEAFREFDNTVLKSKQERSTSCTKFYFIPHREHSVFRWKCCVFTICTTRFNI